MRIEASDLELHDPEAVQERLRRSVVTLQEMVEFRLFDRHEDTVGFELELDLVETLGGPLLLNDTVLASFAGWQKTSNHSEPGSSPSEPFPHFIPTT